MIEEIRSGIYRMEIPLPRNPLKALNAYLIRGRGRNLLVDTGFNWPECRAALLAGLKKVGVNLAAVDFFITHMHADHSGLVYELAAEGSAVYSSEADARLIQETMTADHWQEVGAYYCRHGFSSISISNPKKFIRSYISGCEMDFTYVEDGCTLEVGEYRFSCISTPGHTPGHMCLYEPGQRLLIGGDHILADITSNITSWKGFRDSLGQYLNSLDRIDGLEVDLVLPGHRGILDNCRERVRQLKSHHQQRLHEILAILEQGAMNAHQVASQMEWDLAYDSWEQFPTYQQWFAVGEAISHLEHLIEQRRVRSLEQGGKLFFELIDQSA
ncbi:MAG: MBL fold metallo-hydrolase [Syntrophomonadaceae bacterium]|nr:MBL fold metallo-hydrolase [Syntrophomonadaceae bacterium]